MLSKNQYEDKNRCFILGTGPSLAQIDLEPLKNEITIGVNSILLVDVFSSDAGSIHTRKLIPNVLVMGDTLHINEIADLIFIPEMKDSDYVLCGGCKMDTCDRSAGSTCHLPPQLLEHINLLNQHNNNVRFVYHYEKSGWHNHLADGTELPFEKSTEFVRENFYIDDDLNTFSTYGGGVINDLAFSTAVYLGFKKIYLLGCDGGFDHFVETGRDHIDTRIGYNIRKHGAKRPNVHYGVLREKLNKRGIEVFNCSLTNAHSDFEYRDYKEIINEESN